RPRSTTRRPLRNSSSSTAQPDEPPGPHRSLRNSRMLTHPFFTNILMHSDDELAERLSVAILERETIHEWPLSCVQRLHLVDGTKRIYKSQLPPTVEPEFYEMASSSILPEHRVLDRLGNCATMTFDWIEAPLLRDVAQGDAELVYHGRQVVEQIGEI